MPPLFGNTPVTETLAANLHAMPKMELHVHLEGATDAATVWELAHRNRIELPARTVEELEQMFVFRDFGHFIEVYLLAAGCMRTPEDYRILVGRFLDRQALHNIRYSEVFLSGSLLLDKFPHAELIDALAEGLAEGEKKHGVRARFIPDISRERKDTRFRVLDLALTGKEKGIFCGIGLGGIEVGNPAELFADVFAEARRLGLHVVAHAGETDGASSIWGAIRSLEVERIGHGVRATDDPVLIDHLRRSRTPLEVSPHSNYRLKVVGAEQPHPIRTLVDQGVLVTVNTDDPPMFSTDLTAEYLLLARQGFTWEELWQVNLNALESSFLSPEDKASYRREWQAFASQGQGQ
jgi:adenosine deaminase